MKRNKLLFAISCVLCSSLLTGCIDYFSGGVTPYVPPKTTPTPSAPVIHNDLDKVELSSNYQNYVDNNTYPFSNCPLEGEPKLLIIPIWFTDSTSFISSSKKGTVRSDISKAYFGSTTETGWHSVKSYYEAESSGIVSLSGVVSDWYECGKSYNYFADDGEATCDLVIEASDWYFNNSGASKRDFDSDGNGYLDGVMLIYAAPNYVNLNDRNASNLWAYCYWLQDPDLNNRYYPGPNVFFWASYDFMYSSGTYARNKTGKSQYGFGDTSHCSVDAHTYIHEMGHVFGLEDYYDYSEAEYCPAGGLTMQDLNVGGHDPFSVMALGWANPYIPQNSCTITLGSFQSTHDLILLTPEFNVYNSPFDEYILLELYTPTGLNSFDTAYSYLGNSIYRLPNAFGIRIWHIDARLVHITSSNIVNQQIVNVKENQITTNPDYNSRYGVTLAFSNTYNDTNYGSILGSAYYDYNILQLIRKSSTETHRTVSMFSSGDLFKAGSTFSLSEYSRQFVKGSKMNSGAAFGWNVSITSCTSSSATIELTKI